MKVVKNWQKDSAKKGWWAGFYGEDKESKVAEIVSEVIPKRTRRNWDKHRYLTIRINRAYDSGAAAAAGCKDHLKALRSAAQIWLKRQKEIETFERQLRAF